MLPLIAAFLLTLSTPAASPMSLRSCTLDGSQEIVRCGDLLVPEDPSRPQGRHIKLYFIVLPALERAEGTAPLFDLAGGPGLAATAGASYFLTDGRIHRQRRDVVLVDQRGTGESSPLRCPELELANSLAPMYPPDAVRRCRQTLQQSADLSQYHTDKTVADLEAVRKALG